jgi:LysR family transcriptional regulator, glycine cleavage system transcriptional activator
MAARLPPLVELRAFDATARHLSFKKAAAELGVTPTAISHQIRLLERYCGRALCSI